MCMHVESVGIVCANESLLKDVGLAVQAVCVCVCVCVCVNHAVHTYRS